MKVKVLSIIILNIAVILLSGIIAFREN